MIELESDADVFGERLVGSDLSKCNIKTFLVKSAFLRRAIQQRVFIFAISAGLLNTSIQVYGLCHAEGTVM